MNEHKLLKDLEDVVGQLQMNKIDDVQAIHVLKNMVEYYQNNLKGNENET